MKSSQALELLLFFINFAELCASPQLEGFMKSVRDAHSDLRAFDRISLDDLHRRKRGASVEELLGRFEYLDDTSQFRDSDLTAGDAWYQSFRALECQHGGCLRKPIRWKAKKSQPDDYYEYYEEVEDSPKTVDLKDQWEETPNDLSHEANYKLSKIEQDAVEKNLPNTAWPIHHSAKRSSNLDQDSNLKADHQQIKNGDDPAHLEGEKQISIDEPSHEDNPEPWKEPFEVMERRKLLSVDEPDEVPIKEERMCKSGSCSNKNPDLGEFESVKQKTYLERELEGLQFDNTVPGKKHHAAKKGVMDKLGDELTQSTAFLKIRDFLNGKAEEPNKINISSKPEGRSTTFRTMATVPLNLVDNKNDRDVNIKLHMSVNATVLGNSKLPEEFHKNNTLSFKPSNDDTSKKERSEKIGLQESEDLEFDRDKRGVVFPILTSDPIGTTSKRKTNAEISKSVIEATENFPLDDIITGKLTSELVKTIFAFVKSSPSLKVLWPGLRRNQVGTLKDVQNFYAIRTQDNESEMHRTELMLRQAMETINAIIEQQVRSRSCVPLRRDLKAFYELILKTRAENDKLSERQKRESSAEPTSSLSDTQIRKKSRIVKKLLRDYEDLPREDQNQVVGIKDRLLVAAAELRELEHASRIQKRQIMEKNLSTNNTNEPLVFSGQQTMLTPEYIKLVKTTEMLMHNSLKDPDLSMNFDDI